MSLEQEVVNGRVWGETVQFELLLGLLNIQLVVLVHLGQHLIVVSYLKISVDNDSVLLSGGYKIVEGMSADLLDLVSLIPVRHKDPLNKVLAVVTQEVRQLVVGCLNLLIQLVCVSVLEGQCPCYHHE